MSQTPITISMKYYVYAYIRAKSSTNGVAGTPYYIGKGQKLRAWSTDHAVPLPTDKTLIVIMENGLTEVGAFALERRYISWWGRMDIGTGILRNRADGGEGSSGKVVSAETRQKLSESTKKAAKLRPPMTQSHKDAISRGSKRVGHKGESHPFYNKKRPDHSAYMREYMAANPRGPISDSTRERMRNAQLGKTITPETRAKMSDSRKGQLSRPDTQKPIRCMDNQLLFVSVSAAAAWVRTNTTFPNAAYTNISVSAASASKRKAYGFYWEWVTMMG